MRTLNIDREIAEQQIPQSWQASYRKALSGNRPAAVKVMCGQCQGWEDGARQAIRDCPSVGCPLHAVRPFQKKAGIAASNSAVNEIDTDDEAPDSYSNDNPHRLCDPIADVKSKILNHLERYGQSHRGYIIFATGIPESLWSHAIRELLAENAIEREGEKRNTRYRLKEGG